MKQYLLMFFLMLSSCVIINDGRLKRNENLPKVNPKDKVVVKIVFDEDNIYPQYPRVNGVKENILKTSKNKAKERFEKSNLFKKVLIDEGNCDYIIKIKSFRDVRLFDGRWCDFYTPVITGITSFVIPSFCEYPVLDSAKVEIENINTGEVQSFLFEYGSVFGMGAVTVLLLPFNFLDTVYSFAPYDVLYDIFALRSYQMIKSMRG